MVSKLLIVLAVAIAGVAVVGGAYAFMGDNDSKREGTVEDSVGNKIDISKEYKRISSMTAVGTEIVSDLGLRSSLVGVTNSAHIYEMTEHVYGLNMTFDYPATIPDDITSGKLVGFKWGVKAENVAATDPDLVIMDPASVNKDDSTMKQLQALGIACFVLFEENDWDTIGKNYLSLGKILNKEKRAQEINKACVDADKAVIDKFKGQKSLKVAYVCYCYDTYYIYNQSGAMDAALRLGCTNAMPTNTTTTITPEQIAAADPDIILFDDMGTSLNWTDVIAK